METVEKQSHPAWTIAIAVLAVFMVAVDTLVVTTALPVLRDAFDTDLEGLQWTVNAYELTFAATLLGWAAFGDRYGRRLMFAIGLGAFTLASIGAALAPNIEVLIVARLIQGFGAAAVLPLSLTLLVSVVKPEQRGNVFGAWGGMVGLGIALGPVIGGWITETWSWHWIFWVNVPIGALLLLFMPRVHESRGGPGHLDPMGNVLVTAGFFGIVFGLVRADSVGWTSTQVLTGLIGGIILLALFVAWEARVEVPMVPLSLFRDRGFSLSIVLAIVPTFGVFGAVFLVTQYLQIGLGYSPLGAGVRTIAWTAMPMIAAPIAGYFTDRIGGKWPLVLGLAFQAVGITWIGAVAAADLPYTNLVAPFVITGLGLGMFLPAIADLTIGYAPADMEGMASGASNAVRQLGAALGVSLLGAIFGAYGGYESSEAFADGLSPAMYVAGAVLAVGFVLALALPAARRTVTAPLDSVPLAKPAPAPSTVR